MVLYNNDEYSVIVLSNETDDGDFRMHYLLEKKTSHKIMFSMDDVYVNGYMADPFWGMSIAAGKKLYATACFYESLLSDNGIEAIEEIKFTLAIFIIVIPCICCEKVAIPDYTSVVMRQMRWFSLFPKRKGTTPYGWCLC